MAKGTCISKIDRILKKDNLVKEDIIYLLKIKKDKDLKKLFTKANEIRKKHIGEEIFLRGLLEFSNYCQNDCLYCGIRKSNRNLKRYRIMPDEIIEIAGYAVNNLGLKTVLLQSGEDHFYTSEIMGKLIKKIITKFGCRVALSIGERGVDEYKKFYEAGARRVLMRFETSNKKIYNFIHPQNSNSKNSFEKRVSLITQLKKIGYQVGTGMMIGLPGQTIGDLADDILFYNKLNANMAGMGPFISHPDTPFSKNKSGTFEMSLKAIAVTRICCKDIFISATSALQTLNKRNGRELAIKAGANLLMPNITPKKYRKMYALYPGKAFADEGPDDYSCNVKKIVNSSGRKIGPGYGDTLRR